MRKPLAGIFVVSLIASLALAGWLFHLLRTDLALIVDLKTALFTRSVDTRNLFAATPAELVEQGFRTDDSVRIAHWRDLLESEVSYLADMEKLELPEDVVARAKSIALLFSKGGNQNCGATSLIENIIRVPKGDGCCSDHTEVFLALSSVLGVVARETRQTEHTHSEIYDPATGRWIWIDPQYAIMARDQDGHYLSLLELRDRYFDGTPFDFEFFGTEAHEFAHKSPFDSYFYSGPEDFADVYVVLGNNIFEQDDFRARLDFLPKPAWQLAGMLLGPVPGFAIYSDEHTNRPDELHNLRFRAITIVSLLAIGLLAYPLHAFVGSR